MAGRMTLVAGVLLAMAAAGCAGGYERAPSAPAVNPRWESCPAADADADADAQDALSLPLMDDGFEPVAAVVCGTALRQRAGGGAEEVAVQDRAAEVTQLVAALRLPDERPADGSCNLDQPFVPWVALLDARGRWIRPGIPVNACRKPRAQFDAAYEQLRTERVATRVLRTIDSDAPEAVGCWPPRPDKLRLAARDGSRPDATPNTQPALQPGAAPNTQPNLQPGTAPNTQPNLQPGTAPGTQPNLQPGTAPGTQPGALPGDYAKVRACVYRVPSEQGAAQFESGGALLPATWAAVRREIAAAGPAPACAKPARRFAILYTPAGDIHAEADGCRRILIEADGEPGTLWQGTPALVSLLFAD